jgi:hypothetical protein
VTPAGGYAPAEDPKPLAGYATLASVFGGGIAGFELLRRHRGWELPERVGPADTVLLAVATYKLSRIATKSKVTSFARAPFTRFQEEAGPSEVSEEARGGGLRRAIGELAICPYCVGPWVAGALAASYIRDQRATRMVATVVAVDAASDVLHQGWRSLLKQT